MDNKSKPKAGATALPPSPNGKREGEDEDEKQVSAIKQKRDNVAEELKNKDGATEVPPPLNGMREGENEDEKQASAKKQKRDEISEEQKNKEEIISDYSSSDSEPDKNPEAIKGFLNKWDKICKPTSANGSGSWKSLADGSDKDKGKMNIDEGDNSEESKEEAHKKRIEVLMDAASYAQELDLKNVENNSSDNSSYDDDGNGERSDVIEKSHMDTNPAKGSDRSEDREKEIEKKAFKTPQKSPITLATSREQNATSKTVCVRNLSHSVERADLENLFKDCGEVVDVRLHTDEEGIFRCFGHVEFATVEAAQKALELTNTELLRCRIRVVIAPEKRKYIPFRSFHDSKFSNLSNSFQRSERIEPMKGSEILENCEPNIVDKASKTIQESPNLLPTWKEQSATSRTICARNLAYSAQQADVENFFKECGEIVNVRLHTDHEGRFKGYGHVEFATEEAAQNALELHYTELLGRHIKVALAQEKGEYTSNRSNFSNWRNSFQKSERIQPMKGTDNLEHRREEIDEKASKTPWESENKDVEMPKILGTLKDQYTGSKTIYVRNLSYRVEQANMENLFKEYGEIVEIRLHSNHEGRFNGYGHVEFARAESAQKALELDNTEFLGRFIRVGIVREKSEYSYKRSNWRNSFQNNEAIQPIKGTQNSENYEEEFKEKVSKTPQESPKILATRKEQNAASIYVTNLSYGVERADLEKHFKECGEIVYVRLHTDHEGWLKGSGHVHFATTEAAQKALELDNTELLRRPIRVSMTREKGEYSHNRSNWSNSFKKCESIESQTVYVKGFDISLAKEEIKASLEEHFSSCGEIIGISIPKFHVTGALKGYAHLEFKDVNSAMKALQLDQTELGGYTLYVEKAKPKRDYHNRGSDRGGGGHWFGGRDGSDYSGSGWGRSSGVGWHSSFYGEGTGRKDHFW